MTTHPTHGICDCGQLLCAKCAGEFDPHECLGGPGFHCGACVADCRACQDALELTTHDLRSTP